MSTLTWGQVVALPKKGMRVEVKAHQGKHGAERTAVVVEQAIFSLKDELAALRQWQGHEGEPKWDAPIFAEPGRTNPIGQSDLQKEFRALLEALGLVYNAKRRARSLYSIRHFFATDLLAIGFDLNVTAKQLGNTPAILAKTYDHNDIEKFAEDIRRRRVGGPEGRGRNFKAGKISLPA